MGVGEAGNPVVCGREQDAVTAVGPGRSAQREVLAAAARMSRRNEAGGAHKGFSAPDKDRGEVESSGSGPSEPVIWRCPSPAKAAGLIIPAGRLQKPSNMQPINSIRCPRRPRRRLRQSRTAANQQDGGAGMATTSTIRIGPADDGGSRWVRVASRLQGAKALPAR